MNIYNGHCLNWIILKQYGLDTVWTDIRIPFEQSWIPFEQSWIPFEQSWIPFEQSWIQFEQSGYCWNSLNTVWTVWNPFEQSWILFARYEYRFSSIKMIKHTWLSAYTAWVLFEQYDFYFNVINILWEEKLENYKTAWLLFLKSMDNFWTEWKISERKEYLINHLIKYILEWLIDWYVHIWGILVYERLTRLPGFQYIPSGNIMLNI